MRNPQGYGVTVSPGGAVAETDTLTCGHCGGVYPIPPFAGPRDVGGFCGGCHRAICPRCDQALAQGGLCAPLEKWLDRIERRDRLCRAAGIPETQIGTLVHDDHAIRAIIGPAV